MRAALLLAGVLSVAANAQTVPRQFVLGDYAACVVRQAPAKAERLLATRMGTPEEGRLVMELSRNYGSCLHRASQVPAITGAVRGAFAEALLMRDPRVLDGAARLAPVAPKAVKVARGREFVANYAACLTRAQPVRAATLVRSGHSSQDERKAFLAFGTALSVCMPEDAAYDVNITDVRNHVADALYQALAAKSTGNPTR